MKKLIFSLFVAVLVLTVGVLAHEFEVECSNLAVSKNTEGFLEGVHDIDAWIKECEFDLPGSVNFLLGEGNILVSISMNSGEIENFYASIADKKVSGLVEGVPEDEDYNYQVLLGEDTFNALLNSNDVAALGLEGIENGDIVLKGNSLWNKFKLFFGKMFI